MPNDGVSKEIVALLGEIAATRQAPMSADSRARLSQLYWQEFLAWQGVFERANRRTLWLAALAAGERARALSAHYAFDSGELSLLSGGDFSGDFASKAVA